MLQDFASTALAEHPVNNDKYQNGSEAAASKFFCAVAGNQCFKESVHSDGLLVT